MSPVRLTHATALILQALASGSRHVYPVLRRLEREKAVASEWEDEDAAHEAGRRRRRIYGLTPSGQLLAEQARQRLAATQRVLAGGALGSMGPNGGRGG
jgi:DNA-binding PadR family transcriptional regulator